MSPPFDFVCEHFTAGAVGPPGQRVFYLQAGAAGELVTLRCEKQQVGALGEHLDRILASLPPGPAGGSAIPAELIEPVEPAWIVGALALGFDEDADHLIIQVAELVEEDAEPGATARSTRRATPASRPTATSPIEPAHRAGRRTSAPRGRPARLPPNLSPSCPAVHRPMRLCWSASAPRHWNCWAACRGLRTGPSWWRSGSSAD